MTFIKGHKQGKGRPPGAKNKKTKEQSDALLNMLLAYENDSLEEDFKSLSPAQKLKTYESLLKYIKPTLKQIDNTVSSTLNVIQFALPEPPKHTVIDIDTVTQQPTDSKAILPKATSKQLPV